MGWCSGSQVFDDTVPYILAQDISNTAKYEIVKGLISALYKHDWDCDEDAQGHSNSIVRKAWQDLNPDYKPEEDEEPWEVIELEKTYPIDWMIERKEYITIYYDDLNDFVREQFGWSEDEYNVMLDMDSGEIGTIEAHKMSDISEYDIALFEMKSIEGILLFLVNQDRIPEGTYMIWMD